MEKTHVVFDVETLGLNPLINSIVAIGIKTKDVELILNYESERDILEGFWNFVKKYERFVLVGFNSSAFDIPFVIIRSLKYSIPIPDVRGRSLDLRQLCFFGQRFKEGKLDDFGWMLGVGGKGDGMTGADVPALYMLGRIKEIKQYLLQDIRITYALLERAMKIGLTT